MATADEQNITISSSADADTRHICYPCRNDGDTSTAVKYCVNCKELLCETCCGFHRKVTFTKKHVLVEKEHMQEFEDVNQRKDRCPEHEHVKVEYHCKTHSVFGCHSCFYMHQKTCRDMRMISELSEDYLSSEDNAQFQTDLENIGKRSQKLIKDLKTDKQTVQRDTLSATDAIKQFKRELLDQIDTLEKQLKEKVDKYEEKELKKLDEFNDKTAEIVEEYSNLFSELEILQNKNDIISLYITSEHAREKIQNLTGTLKKAEDRSFLRKLMFEHNKDLAQLLMSPWGIGQISCKENISDVKQIKDIDVKLTNESSCNIYSIKVMPGNKLLMADYENSKVKLYDANEHRVYSSMKLESSPWSIAKISDSTAVVAIPDKKALKFFRTDPILYEGGDLIVNGKCIGVDYGDEKLVVAYSDTHKVEVMDLQGNVIHSIEKDKDGKNLFNNPRYVSIDHKHDAVYVSNSNSNSVVSIKMDGTILDTYEDGDLRYPRQVSIAGTDKVFVCAESNTVHLITRDCKKVKVVLTEANDLSQTRSMVYDEHRDLIYVGNRSNTIKVFKVSYVPI